MSNIYEDMFTINGIIDDSRLSEQFDKANLTTIERMRIIEEISHNNSNGATSIINLPDITKNADNDNTNTDDNKTCVDPVDMDPDEASSVGWVDENGDPIPNTSLVDYWVDIDDQNMRSTQQDIYGLLSMINTYLLEIKKLVYDDTFFNETDELKKHLNNVTDYISGLQNDGNTSFLKLAAYSPQIQMWKDRMDDANNTDRIKVVLEYNKNNNNWDDVLLEISKIFNVDEETINNYSNAYGSTSMANIDFSGNTEYIYGLAESWKYLSLSFGSDGDGISIFDKLNAKLSELSRQRATTNSNGETEDGVMFDKIKRLEKSTKYFFSFIKKIEKKQKRLEYRLNNLIQTKKKINFEFYNEKKIKTSGFLQLDGGVDKTTLDKYNKLFIYDNIEHNFIELLDRNRVTYSLPSKYDVLNGVTIFKSIPYTKFNLSDHNMTIVDENKIELPTRLLEDIKNQTSRPYELDGSPYVIEKELYMKVEYGDNNEYVEYFKLYNTPILSRKEAIEKNGEVVNVIKMGTYDEYEDVMISTENTLVLYYNPAYELTTTSEPIVDINSLKDDSISNMMSYINDNMLNIDSWNSKYVEFNKNILKDIIRPNVLKLNTSSIKKLLDMSNISYKSRIDSLLKQTFKDILRDHIISDDYISIDTNGDVSCNYDYINELINSFIREIENVDGDMIGIDETIMICENIYDSLKLIALNNIDIHINTLSNYIMINNCGTNSINGTEYTKTVKLSQVLNIWYSDVEWLGLLKKRIVETNPSMETMTDLKFIRIPYDEYDIQAAAITADADNIYDYHEIVDADSSWKASETEIKEKEFNFINTKYYSVENVVGNSITINQLVYMFSYLKSLYMNINPLIDDKIKFTNIDISNIPISIMDGLIGMAILVNKTMGVQDVTIMDDSDIKYIYGFNNTYDNVYDIKAHNGNVASFTKLVTPSGDMSDTLRGDCTNIYVGQHLKIDYLLGTVGSYSEVAVYDLIIDHENISNSIVKVESLSGDRHVFTYDAANTYVHMQLLGLDVIINNNNNNNIMQYVNHIDRLDTVKYIIDNYNTLYGDYALTQNYVFDNLTSLLHAKRSHDDIMSNVSDIEEYNKVRSFMDMQYKIKYSRMFFEKPGQPGIFYETYSEYLLDKGLSTFVDWINCVDVDDFDNASFKERNTEYKNRLIELIESMISFIDNTEVKTFLNNSNYSHYMKEHIRTVLLFFKSYTIDIMLNRSIFKLNEFSDNNIKVYDDHIITRNVDVLDDVNMSEKLTLSNFYNLGA